MKIKGQEDIRLMLQLSYLGLKFADLYINKDNCLNLQQYLYISSILVNIDIFSNFELSTHMSDYKELKTMYDKVIENTTILMEELDITDPVSIETMYVYLYRNGYLSANHTFEYNSSMKDLPQLLGMDVVRGSGVCRSIASMLSDIYREFGFNESVLSVYAGSDILKAMKEDSINTKLNVSDDEKTRTFRQLVMGITSKMKIPNHLITMVEDNGINYIFDPTSDGFLQYTGSNNLSLSQDNLLHMKNEMFIKQFFSILGHFNYSGSLCKNNKQLKLPTINYEEYNSIYKQALDRCIENIDLLESFYQQNSDLYRQIKDKSDNQHSYIKRLLPIIHQKNSK